MPQKKQSSVMYREDTQKVFANDTRACQNWQGEIKTKERHIGAAAGLDWHWEALHPRSALSETGLTAVCDGLASAGQG